MIDLLDTLLSRGGSMSVPITARRSIVPNLSDMNLCDPCPSGFTRKQKKARNKKNKIAKQSKRGNR